MGLHVWRWLRLRMLDWHPSDVLCMHVLQAIKHTLPQTAPRHAHATEKSMAFKAGLSAANNPCACRTYSRT